MDSFIVDTCDNWRDCRRFLPCHRAAPYSTPVDWQISNNVAPAACHVKSCANTLSRSVCSGKVNVNWVGLAHNKWGILGGSFKCIRCFFSIYVYVLVTNNICIFIHLNKYVFFEA